VASIEIKSGAPIKTGSHAYLINSKKQNRADCHIFKTYKNKEPRGQ
jgi:hypothetical protein